jgi:uncharacterized protein YndB with AHSA1/START domain
MVASSTLARRIGESELFLSRLIAAPVIRVFAAWTEADHLVRWCAPPGSATPFCGLDLRPGGAYRVCIRSERTEDRWIGGTFREIAPPRRLVFSHAVEGETGETVVTVTLEERDGVTALALHQRPFSSIAEHASRASAWRGALDRLVQYLTSPL